MLRLSLVKQVTTSTELGEAFAALRQPLFAYLLKQAGSADAAEDLLQQVFVKALATRKSGKVIKNLTGWLYTVARTTAMDYHRSQHASMAEYKDIVATPTDEEVDTLREELASCLRPFVETLPVIYRDTLVAIDFQGKSMREVASTTGLSLSAIKSRSSRGRRLLKDRILECCKVEVGCDGSITDIQRQTDSCCT